MWSRYVQGEPQNDLEAVRCKWIPGEYLTTTHPIEWLANIRNDAVEVCGDNRIIHEYALIGWQKISKDIYDKYKDTVG